MRTLGVVGTSPRGWRGVGRFGKLSDFQKQVGELGAPEAQGWWGGHAVCHALMNGVSRVVYATPDDVSDPQAVAVALSRLAGHGPLDGVVVPGAYGLAWAQAVGAAWGSARAQGGWEAHARLWLDAPDPDASEPSALLGWARSLHAAGVSVVGPWVLTQSPGCWRAERVPASCLVGALWLGVAGHLRGAHTLDGERRLDPATEAAFVGASAAWLWASGARQLVRAQALTPLPSEEARGPVTLDERIRAALEAASAAALDQGLPQGPRLWKQIERRAFSAMMGFADAGEVVAFDLRCDAETNDGSAQPVVAVQYRTPQRVQRLSIRLNAL